jgi:hypothetical protein
LLTLGNNLLKSILFNNFFKKFISDSFIFDFENDYETDIIKLKKVGYKVSAFNHCYYFGYQFETDIDSSKRTKFIHSIKFPDGKISERDKNSFIINIERRVMI